MLAGCYGHTAQVHGGEAKASVHELRFQGWADGERNGQARLQASQGPGRAVSLRLTVSQGSEAARGASIHIDTAGRPRSVSAWTRVGPMERRLDGRWREDLSLDLQGPDGRRTVTIAWGPSSGVDPGHPLLLGPLVAQGAGRRRVVRLDSGAPRVAVVDHYAIALRGRDEWGRKVAIESRGGGFAVWVDEQGLPTRVRWRPEGPNGPLEEWRRVAGP